MQPPSRVSGWALRPPSQGAGVQVQGVPTAQQALRPAWANCIQCPRAQRGWHTFATTRRKGAVCLVLVCLLFEAPHTWVWVRICPCAWSLSRTSPPSPSQVRERGWGCRPWRTQDTQELRKGPYEEALIGDVPLMGRDTGRSQDVSPGREGAQPPANHRHQVTEAAELAALAQEPTSCLAPQAPLGVCRGFLKYGNRFHPVLLSCQGLGHLGTEGSSVPAGAAGAHSQ